MQKKHPNDIYDESLAKMNGIHLKNVSKGMLAAARVVKTGNCGDDPKSTLETLRGAQTSLYNLGSALRNEDVRLIDNTIFSASRICDVPSNPKKKAP